MESHGCAIKLFEYLHVKKKGKYPTNGNIVKVYSHAWGFIRSAVAPLLPSWYPSTIHSCTWKSVKTVFQTTAFENEQ